MTPLVGGRRPADGAASVRRVLVLLVLASAAAGASAQPYAAAGGFDRPREVLGETQARPALAAVVDAGVATVVRIAGGRVVQAPIDRVAGAGHVLAQGQQLRDVAAGGSADGRAPALYVWYERDLTSGAYRYWWHTAGTTRSLFDATQSLAVRPVVGPDGPEAYVVRPGAGGATVERWRWADGPDAEPEVVLRSALSLGGLDVLYDAEGGLHLGYLEGFTEAGDLGTVSEWNALHLAPGATAATPLGRAAAPPNRVLLHAGPGGEVAGSGTITLAWEGVDGAVRARVGEAEPVVLGRGAAVGVTDRYVVWRDNATLHARPRPLEDSETVNAAWSPLVVASAEVVQDAEGTTHLLWLGTRAGRGYTAFASDDRQPMTITIADRAAAALGWSPWALTEEVAGQAIAALLGATLLTLFLLPLFWLLASVLVRYLPERAVRPAGALLAVALFAAVALAAGLRAPTPDLWAILGLPFVLPAGLVLGILAALVILRRVDAEALQMVVLGAAVSTFVITTVVVFATFQHWMALFTF